MADHWEEVSHFYQKNGRFLCGKRGCREEEEGAKMIDVQHLFGEPASEREIDELEKKVSRVLVPSHREFLTRWNGGGFFVQETSDGYSGGFGFYSTDELPQIHKEQKEWLRDAMDDYYDDIEDEEEQQWKQDCLKWIEGILFIGEELQSGNYFVVHYDASKSISELPILFLDHEAVFHGDLLKDVHAVGKTLDEVLLKAAEDPARFLMHTLGGCCIYRDGQTDQQWYPKKYEFR